MNDIKHAITAFLGVKHSVLKEIKVSPKFTGDASLSKPKRCFDNIFKYCSSEPFRYEYCLCSNVDIIPIEHAIIYDRITGAYYDPTFQAAGIEIQEDKYFLIKKFSYEELSEHACEFGYPPSLDLLPDLIERDFSFFKNNSFCLDKHINV